MGSGKFGLMTSKVQQHVSSIIIMYIVESMRETDEANGGEEE